MMNKDVTPSLRNPGARTSFSSKSNLETLRHHQNLRGKQLENLTRQPGSSREPKVPQPFGKYREHHCLSQNVCAIMFNKSSMVPFPIV